MTTVHLITIVAKLYTVHTATILSERIFMVYFSLDAEFFKCRRDIESLSYFFCHISPCLDSYRIQDMLDGSIRELICIQPHVEIVRFDFVFVMQEGVI